MNKAELISVVVPVYNVEAYLARCIESIIAQTYRNLEIILVDDGSTDKSGKICDDYKTKYSNLIEVVHQKNRGLSGARNTGLGHAQGKYITFVDSDDWLSHDMIEIMYDNLKKYNAQISGIGFYQAYENGKLVANSSKTGICIMNKEEALGKFLFNNNLTVCVCGKLYQTSLWNTIKCPEGKLFEDQYTTYKLIEQAKVVVFNPSPKYYYFKRKGSIGHSTFSDRTYDLYWGVQEQYDYITRNYPALSAQMAVAKITWEIIFINMMLCGNKKDMPLILKTRMFVRKHIVEVIRCDDINGIRKVQICLFAYLFCLYKSIYFFYKKRKGIA